MNSMEQFITKKLMVRGVNSAKFIRNNFGFAEFDVFYDDGSVATANVGYDGTVYAVIGKRIVDRVARENYIAPDDPTDEDLAKAGI